MIMSHNDVVQKQLKRVPANFLTDLANRCEKDNADGTRELTDFKGLLARKGLINATRTKLEIQECKLTPVWTGHIDLADEANEEKGTSMPSIGWDCTPLECYLEADLVVQNKKKQAFIDKIKLERCTVHDVHLHKEEAHVHIICKGIYRSELTEYVINLATLTLERRKEKL